MKHPYIWIRKQETWIGQLGIFHHPKFFGFELPNGYCRIVAL
jgi:hypothetical protein